MAITPMKAISIFGLNQDIDKVARICVKSEVFHPDDANNFYTNAYKFSRTIQKDEYSPILSELKSVLDSVNFDKEIIDVGDFDPTFDDVKQSVNDIIRDISNITEEKSFAEQKLETCKKNIKQISKFTELDIDIEKVLSCQYIKTTFGKLPVESYDKLVEFSGNPYVTFLPCSKDKNYYWGVYITPIKKSDEVDKIFSGLFFEKSDMSEFTGTPQEYYDNQKIFLGECEEKLKIANGKLDKYLSDNGQYILKYYTVLEIQSLLCSIKNYALHYKSSFIITGWIPADCEKEFTKELLTIESVGYGINDAKKVLDLSPPIKLKNNLLTKPFEFYTEMYGLPAYNEIDPTTFIAITYTLLFGVMFADVGHGIMLLLTALFMCKKKMSLGPLLIPCSISSTIFGFVFGSVFGFEHLLDPMFRFLGFKEKPIEVMEPKITNILIYSAIGLGIVLVIISMMLNIYSSVKQSKLGNALFGVNGLYGMIFYTSLVAGLAYNILLGKNIMNTVYVLLLIVLPIILVFLREPLGKLVEGKEDWKPEKISEFIVDNLFEMLEVALGYVTNTMSFLRVGAFILVHAGMMQVVFVLAETVGGAGYVIILILGNILVMALEALLVGIQVLRLEFYEMFNRFYVGDGRAYSPKKLIKTRKSPAKNTKSEQ